MSQLACVSHSTTKQLVAQGITANVRQLGSRESLAEEKLRGFDPRVRAGKVLLYSTPRPTVKSNVASDEEKENTAEAKGEERAV